MTINWGNTVIVAQFSLCILASMGYAYGKDWKHCVYWALCAGISGVVTWWF